MPEGPEIKVIVDKLILLFGEIEKKIIKFTGFEAIDGQFIDWDAPLQELVDCVVGQPLQHGKAIYIPVQVENDIKKYIKIHLMLAGHITTQKTPKNIIELYFDDLVIGLEDRMHLATVNVVDEVPTNPDIFNITLDEFVELFTGRSNRQIHLALTDQKMMPGIGSYLKSELLYHALINPFTKIKDMDLIHLYQSMRELLDEIVEEGGSSGYEGGYNFKVYKKQVDPHGNKISTKRKVYWVPKIQH